MNPEHTFQFKVAGHHKIAVEKLHAHKAAMRPIDEEDKAVLADSVKNFGVIEDPIVMKSGEGWAILSGCNRVRDAKAAGLAEIICKVIETDNPAAFVSELLCGRKKTSSQRILSYLELNADLVLETNDGAEERRTGNLRKGQCSSEVAHATSGKNPAGFWTADGIAERLHCVRDDVFAGIELLRAMKTGEVPINIWRDEDIKPTEEQVNESFRETVFDIKCGASGLRRWKAAMAGRLTTKCRGDGKGAAGKLPTDFFSLATRALTSVKSSFKNYSKMAGKDRVHVRHAWLELIPDAPADFLHDMSKAAVPRLGRTELVDLIEDAKNRLKEMPK